MAFFPTDVGNGLIIGHTHTHTHTQTHTHTYIYIYIYIYNRVLGFTNNNQPEIRFILINMHLERNTTIKLHHTHEYTQPDTSCTISYPSDNNIFHTFLCFASQDVSLDKTCWK